MAQNKQIVGGLLGLVGFLLTGVVAAFGYLFVVGTILGRRGWENVGAIVTFPVLAIVMGALWLALDWALRRRSGAALPAGRAALFGALLGLTIGFVMAGARGFTTAGGSTLFNYFTIAIGGLGAWLQNLLAKRAVR